MPDSDGRVSVGRDRVGSPASDSPHACERMLYALDEPTLLLEYDDRFREYYIHDFGDDDGATLVDFCPFCGARLPSSLRTAWLERIKAMELEPDDPRMPFELLTGHWWRVQSEKSG